MSETEPAIAPLLTLPLPDVGEVLLQPNEEARELPPMQDLSIGHPNFPGVVGDYRLDTHYTGNPHYQSEEKGEPFTVRLTPGLSQLITIIVESSATPYKTKSDFLRDAAYYLAKAIRDLNNIKDQRFESLMHRAKIQADLDAEAKFQEEITAVEHDLTDAVVGSLERRALHEACRKISKHWDQALGLPIAYHQEAYKRIVSDNILLRTVVELGHARGIAVPTLPVPPTPTQKGS